MNQTIHNGDTTALIAIEEINAADIFVEDPQPLTDLLEKLRALTTSFTPDTSTAKGREEIKALAYRVTRSKTALAELIKDEKKTPQKTIARLIAAGKRIATFCDELKAEIRQPVTDWEAEEELRVRKEMDHEQALIDHGFYEREQALLKREAELEAAAPAAPPAETAPIQAHMLDDPTKPYTMQDVAVGPQIEIQGPSREPAPYPTPEAPETPATPTTTTPAPMDYNTGFKQLRGAMRIDKAYAQSWHDNLAACFYDAIPDHMSARELTSSGARLTKDIIANDGASRFMKLAFDVETIAV